MEVCKTDYWFAWYPVRLGAIGTGRWAWCRKLWRCWIVGVPGSVIYQLPSDTNASQALTPKGPKPIPTGPSDDEAAHIREIREMLVAHRHICTRMGVRVEDVSYVLTQDEYSLIYMSNPIVQDRYMGVKLIVEKSK